MIGTSSCIALPWQASKASVLRVVKRDEAYIEAMARDLLDFAELVNEFQERLKKPLPEAA